MVFAHTTPNQDWNVIHGNNAIVKVYDDGPPLAMNVYNNVDILYVDWSVPGQGANITVDEAQFPHGVIILNDELPPPTRETICTTRPALELDIIPAPHNPQNVNIPYNNGFPCGRIILWD